MGKIKYEFAFDEKDNIVHIDEAHKGQKYYFPNFKYKDLFLIPHKGDKIANHFKSQFLTGGNFEDNESPLHMNCKFMIFLMIKYYLDKKLPFFVKTRKNNCYCNSEHKINLNKSLKNIYCDSKKIGEYLPDILLEYKNSKKVIEIIVSNEVSLEKEAFFKKEEIEVLKFYVDENYFLKLKDFYTKKKNYIFAADTYSYRYISSICDKANSFKESGKVVYFKKHKNIFPCFNRELNEKIDYPINLPCFNCKYFSGFERTNIINCNHPKAKLLGKTISKKKEFFSFNFYLNDGTNFEENLSCNAFLKRYIELNQQISFFEYSKVQEQVLENSQNYYYSFVENDWN